MASSLEITDYMAFQELLTEEEQMVRGEARQFVNAEILPIIEEHAQAQTFPSHLVTRMGEMGFYGPTLPTQYGCAGLSNVAYGLLMYELERGDSGIRSFASVQGSLVMYPIHSYGSEAQKDHWLPRLARGEVVGCFGLTEPDFGSNPAGMKTLPTSDVPILRPHRFCFPLRAHYKVWCLKSAWTVPHSRSGLPYIG